MAYRYAHTSNFLLFYRDEDMQSLASLMSMKQSDIGNLDDFNDSDDEAVEDRRPSFGPGLATPVTGKVGKTLEEYQGFNLNQQYYGYLWPVLNRSN